MKVTAETITLAQLDELWRRACATTVAAADPDLMHACTCAANRRGDFSSAEIASARERCADAWNVQFGPRTELTISDGEIREIRDSQAVTEAFRPLYNDCVRALGYEPLTGMPMLPGEQRAARGRVAAAWNARHGAEP